MFKHRPESFSFPQAANVKKAVNCGLTQRLRELIGDSDSSDEAKDDKNSSNKDAEELTLNEDGASEGRPHAGCSWPAEYLQEETLDNGTPTKSRCKTL